MSQIEFTLYPGNTLVIHPAGTTGSVVISSPVEDQAPLATVQIDSESEPATFRFPFRSPLQLFEAHRRIMGNHKEKNDPK